MTPDEARREARRLLSEVERGLDPAEQLQQERNAITVADLCGEYLAKAEAGLIIGRKGSPKKASTLEVDRGRIARHIIPLVGKKPLKDLTSVDVKRFLEAVMSGKTAITVKTKPRGLARVTGGPTAAVRALGLLGGMLTYAKEVGYIEHNPARGIRKPADKRRSFRLALKGYRDLGHALEAAERNGEHWQALVAIQLLAVTGCRRAEIVKPKWSEVDFGSSCLRLGDTKTWLFHPTVARTRASDLGRPKARRRLRTSGATRKRQVLRLGLSQGLATDCWRRLFPTWPSPRLRLSGPRVGPERVDHQSTPRSRPHRCHERLCGPSGRALALRRRQSSPLCLAIYDRRDGQDRPTSAD